MVNRFADKCLEGVRLSRLALQAAEENYGTFESGQTEKERGTMKRVQNCCNDKIEEPKRRMNE
jgi:hypothetical protein